MLYKIEAGEYVFLGTEEWLKDLHEAMKEYVLKERGGVEPKGIKNGWDVNDVINSSSYRDIKPSDVKEYFKRAIPESAPEFVMYVAAKHKAKRRKRNAQAKKSRKQNRR